jgi:hypothetical protein
MLNLVSRSSIETAGYTEWTASALFKLWLNESQACTHTGLICMEREKPPVMWLFSPFQTRPLGKELPSLLMTCTCPLLRTGPEGGETLGRKVWAVTHNGRDGMLLRNVKVTAACSICRQGWELDSRNLDGHLRRSGGLYAAVVPYFAD